MKKHSRRRSILLVFGLVLILVISINASTATDLRSFAGIYEDSTGRSYLFNPREDFPHFIVMKTGETHMIREKESGGFEYSATRNSWHSIGGTVEFNEKEGKKLFCFSGREVSTSCAVSVPLTVSKMRLDLGEGLKISGELIEPGKKSTNLVAVLLHGDGDNDRFDLYDTGMYLVSEGISIFAFDKRNVGGSNGPQVTGDSYDEISRHYADDAVRIVKTLKVMFPQQRVGVVGGSQGGWIGSIVSSNVPDLAFYVNIAGSVSVGWKQWRHYMISYLKRTQFDETAVAEAEEYFRVFFDAGLRPETFPVYESKLAQYKGKEWFKRLAKRKLVQWKSVDSAVRVVERNSNDPIFDIKKVGAPTLGVFFEFDHSTPPDSPSRFLAGLAESKSTNIAVRVFPNATHGGWAVDSYYFDTSKITRKESRAYYFIARWLKQL